MLMLPAIPVFAELHNDLKGCSIYLTGMMGSGKSTVRSATSTEICHWHDICVLGM